MESLRKELAVAINQVSAAEIQKKQLINKYNIEIAALQKELQQVAALKAIYEDKYNEVLLRLGYLESDLNEKFQENKLIKELNLKIEELNKQNFELKTENLRLQGVNCKYKQECIRYNENLKRIQGKYKKLKTENVKVKAEVSFFKYEDTKLSSKSIERCKKQTENAKPKSSRVFSSSKNDTTKSILIKSPSVSTTKSQYFPSFLRNKISEKSFRIESINSNHSKLII